MMQVAPAWARCSRSAGVRAYPMAWAPTPWAASMPAGDAVIRAHSPGVALSVPDCVFEQVGKSAGQEDSPERPVLISISNLRINKMAITSIITDSNSATTEMANSQNSTLIL